MAFDARMWVDRFGRWYNIEHRHSKLRFVTPEQRHSGDDAVLLEQRSEYWRRPNRVCRHAGYTPRQKLRAYWADDVEPGKGTAYEASCVASKQ